MIHLQHISKSYRIQNQDLIALNDISLEVTKGQIFGVIGRSGAGKSTLIRTVNLLEHPDQGVVMVDGVDLTGLADKALIQARRQMGMIFQHFNLLATRSVFDNVALPLEISGHSKAEMQQRVLNLLEFTGLKGKEKVYPHELSGGQKQRVAIARALANQPKVLLSDEATSALDPETTDVILNLLKAARDEFGLTILLITHEMDVIRKICDKTCVLDQGQIVEQGDTLNLFTRPEHLVTKNFVYSNFHVDLPASFKTRLVPAVTDGAKPVVRFTFTGHNTEEPVLLELFKQFQVTANILQANFHAVHGAPMGMCVCELFGESAAIERGMQFLKSQHVEVEVLGYVKP